MAQLPPGNRGPFAGPMGLLYLKAGRRPADQLRVAAAAEAAGQPELREDALLAVAGIAVLVGLFLMGQMMIAAEEGAITTLNDQIQDAEGKLKIAREHGKRLKAMQDWANPTWLDEVYELAGRTDLKRVLLDSLDADSLRVTARSRRSTSGS